MSTTQNSKVIKATPETLFKAFTDPKALSIWFAPEGMTGKVHSFDLREGGGYQMSLYYSTSETSAVGKTTEKEDRYYSRFVELTPHKKIVQSIIFDSSDPSFAGEMTMEVIFEPLNDGTKVTFLFKNIPYGIRPEDNEAGTLSTLDKLANYVE